MPEQHSATSERHPHATRPFQSRLAVVFDFDKTLAPSSYNTLLEHIGVEPYDFREEYVEPLSEAGWDDTLARFYTLIRESRSRDDLRIDLDFLEKVGESVDPYPGVEEMFGHVREWARAISEDVEVEFYLLTCGFVDMHRGMAIAEEFEDMWGSEFHFDDDGEVDFIKQMITFPEKVRYVMQLSKGLGTEGPNAPADVWREVPADEIHVPLDQIVYVGDGGSDMPVFELMHNHGGLAIGVFEADAAEGWGGHDAMYSDRRVQNLAPADYSEGSELMESLRLSVESICKLIELRRLSQDE